MGERQLLLRLGGAVAGNGKNGPENTSDFGSYGSHFYSFSLVEPVGEN